MVERNYVFQPYPGKTLSEKIWGGIAKKGDDECWLWTRGCSGPAKFRYGAVTWEQKSYLVHRFVWQEANGPIPPKMLVRHKCDVPLCCNPAHLELGTHQDNSNDCVKRGRTIAGKALRGSRHRRATALLTAEQVERLRRIKKIGKGDIKRLAQKYEVKPGVISAVIRGKTWLHIQQPDEARQHALMEIVRLSYEQGGAQAAIVAVLDDMKRASEAMEDAGFNGSPAYVVGMTKTDFGIAWQNMLALYRKEVLS